MANSDKAHLKEIAAKDMALAVRLDRKTRPFDLRCSNEESFPKSKSLRFVFSCPLRGLEKLSSCIPMTSNVDMFSLDCGILKI